MTQPTVQKTNSRKPRPTTRLADNLDKRLLAYLAAASAAGAGLMTASRTAEAEVLYTPAHVVIHPVTNDGPWGYNLDLNHDGIIDFQLAAFAGATTNYEAQSLEIYPCYCKDPNGVVGTNVNHTRGNASALRAGVLIGPALQFLPNSKGILLAGAGEHLSNSGHKISSTFQGQFANGGKGVTNRYLGLKFLIDGEVHYGWARITIGRTSLLTGYAYETEPNVAILTGALAAVPAKMESAAPATLGLLALGADGVAGRRGNQATAK